jgi:hypothetical protein
VVELAGSTPPYRAMEVAPMTRKVVDRPTPVNEMGERFYEAYRHGLHDGPSWLFHPDIPWAELSPKTQASFNRAAMRYAVLTPPHAQ